MVPTPRQQRIAAAFASDIWPLFPARAAALMLRGLPTQPPERALEVGCADGRLTLEVATRLAPGGHLTAIDASPPLIALATAEQTRRGVSTNVSFRVGESAPPFPVEKGECDLVFSNLALAEVAEPRSALRSVAGCLDRGGVLLATFPMRGCWGEFLDIYRDVLTGHRRFENLAGLRTYESSFPDPTEAAHWLESAGLVNVSVETTRWELLFRSAREFFFSPVVELGPLPHWQQIAGGRGDAMQDTFFLVKEAIDAYFLGGPFPLTMIVGCLRGQKA